MHPEHACVVHIGPLGRPSCSRTLDGRCAREYAAEAAEAAMVGEPAQASDAVRPEQLGPERDACRSEIAGAARIAAAAAAAGMASLVGYSEVSADEQAAGLASPAEGVTNHSIPLRHPSQASGTLQAARSGSFRAPSA